MTIICSKVLIDQIHYLKIIKSLLLINMGCWWNTIDQIILTDLIMMIMHWLYVINILFITDIIVYCIKILILKLLLLLNVFIQVIILQLITFLIDAIYLMMIINKILAGKRVGIIANGRVMALIICLLLQLLLSIFWQLMWLLL